MTTFPIIQCALTRQLNELGHSLPVPAKIKVLAELYAKIRGEAAPETREARAIYLRAVFEDTNPNTIPKNFYASHEWRVTRYEVLRRSNGRCACCGASAKDGATLHVDHIMPRSKFPALALDPANLQVLCGACNIGKGTDDTTDWRNDCEPGPVPREGRTDSADERMDGACRQMSGGKARLGDL